MSKPSCLSCQHSRPFSPSGTRAQKRYRCSVFLFLVDASTVPGETVECNRFSVPELPFAYVERKPLAAELL